MCVASRNVRGQGVILSETKQTRTEKEKKKKRENGKKKKIKAKPNKCLRGQHAAART